MNSPYDGPITLRARIRRRVEWALTTDFDPTTPLPPHKVRSILTLILFIIVAGGLKHHV